MVVIMQEEGHITLSSRCEKCPNTELFLFCTFLFLVQIGENPDQKELHIWTFFAQCVERETTEKF